MSADTEIEDGVTEAMSEETGRALIKPATRGIITAVIGISTEKIVEYSVVALVVVVTAGAVIVYIVVKHKKKIARLTKRAMPAKKRKTTFTNKKHEY